MHDCNRLLLLVFILPVLAAAPLAAREDLHWDFTREAADWAPSPIDPNTGEVTLSAAQAREGSSSLAVSGKLPKSFGVMYTPWQDWTGYRTLSFYLFVPPDAPDDLDTWVYIKDRQYLWYQTAPFRSAETGKPLDTFKKGQWLPVTIDISNSSTAWEPGGHKKAWHRVLFYPREFGIRFFSNTAWEGTVYIDSVRLTGNEPPLGRRPAEESGEIKWGLEVSQSTDTVPMYEKFEVVFDLDRHYENPFDPAVVNVEGRFLTPDGQQINVPGFYYQGYTRSLSPEGFERLTPVGGPDWRIRFAADQEGEYRYYVSVRDALGELRSAEQRFTVTSPIDPRGYVRVSTSDPRYFEFDNGEFFYPTGLNMRDGGDQAEAQKGTYDFDYFFQLFSDNNLNFVRTWMAAWWGGIEWSEDYHSRFDGVGRYSMYNAWRLDYMFDLAREHDLMIELTLNSHGQFRRDKFDAEWHYNPYSVRNGGFVASPAMFFTSRQAREMIKQRNRYIIARWGYSRNLMAWDLVNEVDLSEGYNRAESADWHREMGAYIKNIDPWKHLVVTHICLYGSFGDELWQLPEIEYIQADAYWGKTRDIGMNEAWKGKQHYTNKPFLFIEYGPQTVSLPISMERWQQDFRVGMWVSNLMPAAAPGVFWYHREWDEFDLGRYQQGMIAYNAGEDRRGMNLTSLEGTATAPNNVELRIQAMGNGRDGYAYVFSFENLIHPEPDLVPEARRIPGAAVNLPGFADGAYVVEFWDTIEGKVIGAVQAAAADNSLAFTTLPFAADLAMKIKPAL